MANNNGIVIGGVCDRADVVMAHPWDGVHAVPGSRIDLKCAGCGCRVVLCPTSIRLIERGAKVVCNDCVIREAPRMARAILNDPNSSAEERAQAKALLDLEEAAL